MSAAWYLARGGGLVAFTLVSASVALGLALSLRLVSPAWPRFLTNELHRHLVLLALSFAGVHVVAILVDPLAHVGLLGALVPFLSGYRPVWTGLGVVALALAAAIWISTALRAGGACTTSHSPCTASPSSTGSLPAPTAAVPGRLPSI